MTGSRIPRPFSPTHAKREREDLARRAERNEGALWNAGGRTAERVKFTNEELTASIEQTRTTLEEADAQIAEAQAETAAAAAELDQKLAESDAAQAQLKTTVDTLQNETLPALDGDLTAAEGRLGTAEKNLTTVFGQLGTGTVDSRIATAKTDAISTAAGTAQSKADAAKAAAIAAAAQDAQTKADTALAAANAQVAQVIARGASLVRNGDFEAPDGWAVAPYAPDNRAAIEAGNARSGAKALRIGPNPGGNVWPTSEWVPGATGRTYYLEMWVKKLTAAQVDALGGGFVVQAKTTAGGTGTLTIGRVSSDTISTTGFTKVSTTYTLTTADTVAVRFAPWFLASNNVYAIDDMLVVDVTEAQAALTKATDAATAAAAAQKAAGDAQQTADGALTMAGSKSKVYYGTTVATGTATAAGDVWRQVDDQNNVIAEWRWDTSVTTPKWTKTAISSSAISNLDVGKLTVGSAAIIDAVVAKFAAQTAAIQTADIGNLFVTGTSKLSDLVAKQIAADSGAFIKLDVSQLTATTASLTAAVIEKLYADVVNSRKITTQQLVVSGENLMANGFGENKDNSSWSLWGFDAADKPAGTFGSFTYSTQNTVSLANNQAAPPVEEDTYYILEGWIKASVAGSRVYLEAMPVGGTTPNPRYILSSYAVPTTWTRFSVPVKTTVGQTGMYFRMFANHSQGTVFNATQKLAGLSFRKQNAAALIALGGIVAPHITASQELTAKVAQFLKVTAAQIDVDVLWAETSWTTKAQAHLLQVLSNQDGSGYTSTVTGQGLKVTYTQKDAGGNVVRVQPVVQLGTFGDDLISLYKDGKASFSANADGDVAARSLTATDEIYYQGRSLTDIIYAIPRGHVSAAIRTTDQEYNSVSNNPEQPYLRLDVELEEGRLYKVWSSPVRIGVSPGQWGYVRLHAQVGGVAGVNSPILNQIRLQPEGSSGVLQEIMTPNPTSPTRGKRVQCSFLIGNVTPPGGGESGIRAGGIDPVRLEVEDIGPLLSTGNGVWLVGANQSTPAPAPAPARITYDRTLPNQDRRTYDGSGNQYTWPYPRGGQGQSPAGYGNLRSIWTFQNILPDLSGATIHEVWAYFKFDQWFNNAGGTARIGLHGNLALPATYNANQTVVAASGGWPAGADRWVKIPEAYYGGFANGTWRGFTLIGDGTTNTYGLASNSQLRIVYSKAG